MGLDKSITDDTQATISFINDIVTKIIDKRTNCESFMKLILDYDVEDKICLEIIRKEEIMIKELASQLDVYLAKYLGIK